MTTKLHTKSPRSFSARPTLYPDINLFVIWVAPSSRSDSVFCGLSFYWARAVANGWLALWLTQSNVCGLDSTRFFWFLQVCSIYLREELVSATMIPIFCQQFYFRVTGEGFINSVTFWWLLTTIWQITNH